jgi:pyrroline-5-carboxylate reductase
MTMAAAVVLVGCGNMGRAMLEGWLAAGRLTAGEALVVEPAEVLRAKAAALGVTALADAGEIGADERPRLIVFAVKPQVILDIVPAYARFKESATYVSIAAGTPVAAFQRLLGDDAAIVRCMPNTPAAIGKGMMVTFANSQVTQDAAGFVRALLSASGRVAEVSDEALMDAVTAVSGSGPAYVFHFIECLTAAAEAAGLPAETAKLLAMQTVYGAAALAEASGEEPGELRRQVTSPNGTTAAALSVLMGEDRLKTLLTEAVEAARARSVELGG